MPVGYLVPVIVVAIPTLFALVPLRSVPNLSFRLGLLLNELPFVGFFWLLCSTRPWRSPRVTSTRRAAGRPSGWPP